MADPIDTLALKENSLELIERNRETNWADLPDQKKAFAYEYVVNGYKHGNAAETVGLARSGGLRVLRDPLVSAFIQHLQEKHFTTSIITKQFVEDQYLQILPFLKGEEEIPIVNGQGIEGMAKKFHASELTGVLRDLSKVTGYQKEDESNKNITNIQINLGAVVSDPEKIINER